MIESEFGFFQVQVKRVSGHAVEGPSMGGLPSLMLLIHAGRVGHLYFRIRSKANLDAQNPVA